MSFLINGRSACVAEIYVRGKSTEAQTIDRVKAFVRSFAGEMRPGALLKKGSRPGGELWLFHAEKREGGFIGVAKCLLMAPSPPNDTVLRELGRRVSDDFVDLKILRIESEEEFFAMSEGLI
jgi:hypothetical protein